MRVCVCVNVCARVPTAKGRVGAVRSVCSPCVVIEFTCFTPFARCNDSRVRPAPRVASK